ncbi:2Fe-2S iron-sulfur cluster-binding protein [Sphingobium lactosutens]|nr:2Fe-2S iron-sulfur cluster-binding protein [Sphingobium lactosutens]
MTEFLVIDREGNSHEVEGAEGASFMEAIRDAGIDEMLALCGGCLSCATCHVYVEEAAIGRLPAMSAEEDDLLDGSDHRTLLSRLACQIFLSAELSGLRIALAPED